MSELRQTICWIVRPGLTAVEEAKKVTKSSIRKSITRQDLRALLLSAMATANEQSWRKERASRSILSIIHIARLASSYLIRHQ